MVNPRGWGYGSLGGLVESPLVFIILIEFGTCNIYKLTLIFSLMKVSYLLNASQTLYWVKHSCTLVNPSFAYKKKKNRSSIQ